MLTISRGNIFGPILVIYRALAAVKKNHTRGFVIFVCYDHGSEHTKLHLLRRRRTGSCSSATVHWSCSAIRHVFGHDRNQRVAECLELSPAKASLRAQYDVSARFSRIRKRRKRCRVFSCIRVSTHSATTDTNVWRHVIFSRPGRC